MLACLRLPQHSVELNFIEQLAPFAEHALSVAGILPPAKEQASSTMQPSGGGGGGGSGVGERSSIPCRFSGHCDSECAGDKLRACGVAEEGEPDVERQQIPGTDWAMQFDDDGEPEYVNLLTGQVVWDMPPEVAKVAEASGN